MAIMRKLMARKQKEMSLTSSPPRYTRLSDNEYQGKVRKGYVPVIVGEDEGLRERFFIPTQFISHPIIVSLLESSADEFGYKQGGVLQIPTDPDYFRKIIGSLQ